MDAGIRIKQRADVIWWVAAGVLALASLRLQSIFPPEQPVMRELVSQATLFLAGALIGTFRPVRPWRWGAASFVAFGLADIAHLGSSDAHLPELSLSHWWMHIVNGAPEWALMALPVMIGAYVAMFLTNADLS
jgi:hypothetical protein